MERQQVSLVYKVRVLYGEHSKMQRKNYNSYFYAKDTKYKSFLTYFFIKVSK